MGAREEDKKKSRREEESDSRGSQGESKSREKKPRKRERDVRKVSELEVPEEGSFEEGKAAVKTLVAAAGKE